jgi:DNA-binding IclR family transcriptional regulator
MSSPNVIAIERALDIFEAFQRRKGPLSLTDLAETIDIPKSTCHAIVNTLMARGYIYTLSRPRSLYPTKRLHDVARDILDNDPFIERAMPLLESLRDASGETIILGKRQGDSAIYLQVVESGNSIRYSAKPGDIKPLHSSSIGKALLGCMKEAELREWAAARSFPQVTANTITNADALVSEVLGSRRDGFFQTRGENVSDVWAIAAFLTINRETLAVAIAGPGHRMETRIEEHAQRLVGICSLIANRLTLS